MKGYHDIVGDGGSDVLGQVAGQRAAMAGNLAGVRHVVAVGSGKGGVGKSTLTLQLARALRARDWHVAILDADLNGPSQARMAGVRDAVVVPGRAGVGLPRTVDGVAVFSMGSLLPETAALEFGTVAAGESQTWRATREFTLLGEILRTSDWGRRDVLLCDLPPGAERTVQYAEYFGRRAAFVLVTLPSDVARGVVARSAAALAARGTRVLGYVENMSGYYCRDCGAIRPLFAGGAPTPLDLPCLGTLPFDPEVAGACDRGEAAPADSPVCAAVGRIAARLMETLEADGAATAALAAEAPQESIR